MKFWDHLNGDDLPKAIDLAVFDFGVHSGPSRGVIGLQRALGLADDGKVQSVTIAAAKKADPRKVINDICDERLAFLQKLKVFKSFGPGLTSRVKKCRAAALAMI